MDVTNLEIENKCGASTICFGNALNLIYKHLPKYRRIIVITDENVASRYRSLLRHFEQIVIGTGEDNKNLQTAMMVYERLMAMGADTHSYLLGVGVDLGHINITARYNGFFRQSESSVAFNKLQTTDDLLKMQVSTWQLGVGFYF